ncbi:MAG: TolC family protein [Paludibacter sp.]|jgi:outer membrane protein TolC|nr:TolC family protein [Paludibacter sp.]
MRKLIFSTFLLMSFLSFGETYVLDLEQSIAVAREKSFSMLRLVQDFKIAENNLKAATSRFKTHIDLNITSPEYTETIRTFEDSTGLSFYPVKRLNYQTGLVVNQPLPTDGNIYMRNTLYNFDDFFSNNRLTQMNMRVGLTQPLHSFYGYNSIRSSFRQAKLAYERSSKQLKREELNLVYDVSSAFYNLLSVQKSEEIARLDLDRQLEAYEIARNKFEAGLIREVDALQMEVDLAESQNNYDLALVNQNSAANYFKELIGLQLADSVVLSTQFDYRVVIVDPEKAVRLAMANRLEIREQEIQVELNTMSVKQQKAEGMIRANLNAYYEKAGVSTQDINTQLRTALGNAYSDFLTRPQNYGVGLNITIPLLDWGENKAQVRAAEARLKQNILRKEEVQRSIEREVRNLVDDLNSSLKRLQLLEKNLKVAEKSFEITRQRFSDGDIDSQALALERNRLNNAYNSHLRAYINYQLKLADIMRRTFYDFQKDKAID